MELNLIMEVLSKEEVCGNKSVEVKLVDIRKKKSGEGEIMVS